jgi:hypothetical protein
MKTRYQPASRSSRAVAAAAAVVTVMLLFNFVAGLGETKSEALAQLRAAQTVQVASAQQNVSPAPVAQ